MSYQTTVLADTPTLYWRLGTTVGTETDLSTNGHDLTYAAGVTRGSTGLLTGDANKAATFTGAGDSYASTPSDAALPADIQAGLPFTIELLFKATATSGRLVSKGAGGSGGWALGFNGGKLEMTYFTVADIDSTQAISTGTTYHCVVIGKANGSADFYLNGAFVENIAGGTLTQGGTADVPFTVGGLNAAGGASAVIDEVAFYAGVALSSGRIAAHYTASQSGGAVTSHPRPDQTAPMFTLLLG